MKLILNREPDDGTCTLGQLIVGTEVFQTIERPWIADIIGVGGRKGVSCVPRGTYRLIPHDSEAHPRTWALVNPELDVYHEAEDAPIAKRQIARTAVLIHPANRASELRGCIAPGMERVNAGDHWEVRRSRLAFGRIQTLVSWVEHELYIP